MNLDGTRAHRGVHQHTLARYSRGEHHFGKLLALLQAGPIVVIAFRALIYYPLCIIHPRTISRVRLKKLILLLSPEVFGEKIGVAR